MARSELSESFIVRIFNTRPGICSHLKIPNWKLLFHPVEQSGISRVDPHRRKSGRAFRDAFEFWFGCNFTTFNIVLGMIGPLTFSLSFTEGLLFGSLGIVCGSVPVALLSSLGPASGLRTMVIGRYVTGWYPAKFISFLNMLMLYGYAVIDLISAGNILSALLPNSHSSASVGVVVFGIIAILLALVGNDALHAFEQWAWLPQLMVICLLLGVTVPNFEPAVASGPSIGGDIISNRLGFFSLVFSAVITYSTTAADYFVHFEETSRWRVMAGSGGGLVLSSMLLVFVGILLGAHSLSNQSWEQIYYRSPAALVVESLRPLGTLGKLGCGILSLGNVGAAASGIYSQALALQAIQFVRAPRLYWTLGSGFIVLVCAIAGRDSLATALQNFVAVAGYWVAPWLGIFAVEHFAIRRGDYDWTDSEGSTNKPPGYAVSASFLFAVVSATLTMAQNWFVGPLVKLIRPDGVDLGHLVGFISAVVVHLILRPLEERYLAKREIDPRA